MKKKISALLKVISATLILVLTISFFFITISAKKQTKENEFVPQWAKNVVWYQVFPERFSNGDTTNDPTLADVSMAFPYDTSGPWKIHPWGSDWYELQPYEKVNNKDIWHNLQRRRYGGDLQGLINKLDYLQELGITAIYINPIFSSPSLHKYDAISLHHVEPTFGPDPEGDRKIIKNEIATDPSTWQWTSADLLALELIAQVHKRNMRIIFDGVFNHMGYYSFAFQDVVKKQLESIYKDWFTIKSWNDSANGTSFDYEGWFGHKSLPEFKENDEGLNKGVSDYIFAITERWMNPVINGKKYDGIDGWRLDVAFCVNHNFWKKWRNHVKSINPDAYLTAEIVDSISVVQQYLQGNEFDAIMNYNFAFVCADFFLNEGTQLSPIEFDGKLKHLREAYPDGVSYVQQNLFNSHDANRLSSHIQNAGIENYENWGAYFNASMGSNKNYLTQKPDSVHYEIQKLMALFQMTYVGAPLVYYGDEVGMWGANDPDCRKPMIWKDIAFDDEVYKPDQSKLSYTNKVEQNRNLLSFYKKIIHLRNSYKSLQTGSYQNFTPDSSEHVFAFKRKLNDEEILIVLNRNNGTETIHLDLQGEYRSILSNGPVTVNGYLSEPLKIGPYSGIVLQKINDTE